MKISGPARYKLSFDAKKFTVKCPKGTDKFCSPATSKLPKLYIVSINKKPVYVGVTKQSMRNRLRYGFTASGRGGYYGYAWRREFTEATIDIWCHENGRDTLDIETVEAEVVFLIRSAGQWPPYQTEIHFHSPTQMHREVATAIWRTVTKNGQRET